MPNLPVTVSDMLYNSMKKDCGEPFADSYLSGATESTKTLLPHTVTSFLRLKANRYAMRVISEHGLTLVEPLPFGHPDRPDTRR